MTKRILIVGASLLTLGTVLAFALTVSSLLERIHGGAGNALEQGVRILAGLVLVCALAMFTASLWLRLFRRQRLIQSMAQKPTNPYTPRSKYAVWEPVRPVKVTTRGKRRLRKSEINLRHTVSDNRADSVQSLS